MEFSSENLPSAVPQTYTQHMSTQPAVEDISAVVSRFQAWAGRQTQSNPEAREISYEEALRPKRQKAPAKKRCAQQRKTAPVKQNQPAFRQVLAEKTAILPAAKKTTAAALAPRTATLSVRITDAEQKLLKLRAAEAGLSASAYLRQCILDVDDLREQVRDLLAENQRLRAQASGGILSGLAQFMRRIFGGNTAALSVRA
jgi:hypothetical protein